MEFNDDDLESIKEERAAVDEQSQSNIAYDGMLVYDLASKPSDRPALDEELVLSRNQLQMPYAVDTFPEWPNSSNEPTIETTGISLYHDADDNADDNGTMTAHISSDHANKLTLGVTQADIAQEPFDEADREAIKSSEEKRSGKRRRRRRRKIKNHHGNSRKDHGTLSSKRSVSGSNRTSQRSGK